MFFLTISQSTEGTRGSDEVRGQSLRFLTFPRTTGDTLVVDMKKFRAPEIICFFLRSLKQLREPGFGSEECLGSPLRVLFYVH